MVFKTKHNENDSLSGGCIGAGVHKANECEGPWLNFPLVKMEYPSSPHTTLCSFHLQEALEEYSYDEEQQGAEDALARG